MGEQNPSWLWRVMGRRVTGAAHQRAGKPCQDAIGWREEDGAVVLVVADGHGSERSPHSDEGARLAVDIATAAPLEPLRQLKGYTWEFIRNQTLR